MTYPYIGERLDLGPMHASAYAAVYMYPDKQHPDKWMIGFLWNNLCTCILSGNRDPQPPTRTPLQRALCLYLWIFATVRHV